MQLNLPILDKLANSHNILIAGAGGGFDIFSGLPIYFTLRAMGKKGYLAQWFLETFNELRCPILPRCCTSTVWRIFAPPTALSL